MRRTLSLLVVSACAVLTGRPGIQAVDAVSACAPLDDYFHVRFDRAISAAVSVKDAGDLQADSLKTER